MAAVGPGVIVLGASIGGGEFLLGPTVFVRHGLTLLWVTTVAVFFQTVFNTELMRYTLATGEPAFTGFMRTRPHAVVWAWFYAVLFFLQVGWPASAGVASGAIFYLFTGRMAGAGRRQCRVSDRRLHVPAVRGAAVARTANRANAGAAQLGHGRVHAGRVARPGAAAGSARDVGGRDCGTGRVRHLRGASSTSCRRTPTSSCWRPSSPTPGAAG